LLPLGSSHLVVLGGHEWGFSNAQPIHDLRFSLETGMFTVPTLLMPNRFAASCCPAPRAAAASEADAPGRYLIFGGLNEDREPCNDLLLVDLAANSCARVQAIGQAPPAQFKGGMALAPSGDKVAVFDGYLSDGGAQKVHLLSRAGQGNSMVWRTVCSSAGLVRFASPTIMGGAVVALVGGMERRGAQRRASTIKFFDFAQMHWVGGQDVSGFEARTAHTTVAVPPEDRHLVDGAKLVSYGGCIEIDGAGNNRGRSVGTVDLIRVEPPSLKYFAAVALLTLVPTSQWLPVAVAAPDDVLDELF
jgi:hypothetical protein